VLLAEYTAVLVGRGDRIDAAAPLFGAGLLLYAELASWAREANPQVRDERPVLVTRSTVVAASALAALGLGVLVLLAAALPAGGGLARLAIGVVATTLTLVLVVVVARPMSTRAPRG
jgi:multisubunit Na+/H+ antiporter MnhB subunit